VICVLISVGLTQILFSLVCQIENLPERFAVAHSVHQLARDWATESEKVIFHTLLNV
jgi:hypothetical protein